MAHGVYGHHPLSMTERFVFAGDAGCRYHFLWQFVDRRVADGALQDALHVAINDVTSYSGTNSDSEATSETTQHLATL